MGYLMGIDIGTSGAKTALFGETGELLASHTAGYPLYQPQNGWAEQEPDDWWKAVKEGIRAVLAANGISPENISGIGLSGQMHGLVMQDGGGKVLRRSIIWCDQRTSAECGEITHRVGGGRLMEITKSPATTGFTASKILWVRNREPEIYEKCRHILLPKDYIRYRLTGEFATDVSDASGTQLLNIAERKWSQEILEKLEIDPETLPKAYESPEPTGCVSVRAAGETGLAAGTPVVAGAGDNAAAAVGTGTVRDGTAFVTIGTSGVLYAHTSRISVDPEGRIHTFCCAVPGEWHVMGVTQAAGLSLKWFRDTFCKEEKAAASLAGENPYAILDREAVLSPIGANRLLYLPYLMGERSPHLDPDARGVFFGLSASHAKRDLLRAVMEGVTYSLKDCLAVFEETGIRLDNITACGGGGSSLFWRQMLADVFGLPVRTTVSSEGGALGAALLAGAGTGVYSSVHEACEAAVRINGKQLPAAENTEAYSRFYSLYTRLYSGMKEYFSSLAKL